MGWASGFQAGSQMARQWLDTYEKTKEQKALQELSQARPEEFTGYTAEQGQQLEAIAKAINPETGKPYYQIEALPGTAQYKVTPTFDGQAPVDIAPQQVTEFLGRRYEGQMTPAQETSARTAAMADIVAARDPYEAQRLRTAALQEKEAALRISDAERTIRVNESNDAAAKIMASAAAAGQPLDMQFISKVIADTGASPDFVTKNALNSLGLDEKMAAKLVKDKVRDLSKAATDLPSFNKYLAANFDPNQEDNIVPTVVQTKNGLQVMYGGQPLQGYGTYKNLNEVVADVKGKIEGDPLGAAVTIANLDKIRAQADEARSKSVSNQAYADWIKRDRPTAGKTAPTLTDVEKIAYNKAIDAIANLGPDATQQQIASEYRRFGLDPARFGVQGLPSWTPTEAGGLAPSAAGFSKTIPKPNVTTRQPSSALPTQPSGNFVRERQSNGTYKYRDLDTNKLYSTEEYNRIISR